MTYVLMNHASDSRPLTGSEQAGEIFDLTVREILWHGGSGQSFWIGPEGAEEDLRVDIDIDVSRAVLTWLADETIGIELEPGPSITVVWSENAPLVTVPGTLARVSAKMARRAVVEYVTTGERPTCVHWVAGPDVAMLARTRTVVGDEHPVDPERLRAHASALDALRARFGPVRSAIRQIDQSQTAFGLHCGWVLSGLGDRHGRQDELVAYIEESLFLVAEGVRGVADGDGDLIQMIDGPEASPPSENTVTTVDAPTSATVDGWPTPASEKMLDVMVDDVKSREWVERLLADGAPVVEFAAPATDSFAALRAGGLDLALAGIPPLRQMLDDLTGMPDVVACQANSWNRISTDLRRIGADLRSQLDRDFAGQHGRQVRAYQAFMSHNVDAVGGLTATSNALAVVTKAAGDLILLTRDIVRGLIADLVVRVIVWVAETTVVSMSVMASRLATVISTGWRIQAYVTALVTSMSNLAWYVDVNE